MHPNLSSPGFSFNQGRFCSLLVILLVISACDEGSISEQERKSADPRAPQFLVAGQDAFRLKSYEAAFAMADSAEKYAPNLADIYLLRGLIYSDLRQYDKAEAAYKKVLSIDPVYTGAWLNLGTTALRQGDADKAIELYRKELQLNGSPLAMHQIARVFTSLGEGDSAIVMYAQAIEKDSSRATSFFRLAEIYKESGDLEKALNYASRGLKRDPENVNYQYFIGSLYLLKGNVGNAIDALQAVVEKRPWHYWGNYNLGQAFIRKGDVDQGTRYLATAESLQVELKNIQDWENLAESNPDQLMLWANLGEAYRRAGRLDEAIEAFNIALNIEPRFVALRNNLANLYIMNGDTAAAELNYEMILSNHPAFTDVWLNLGIVYATSGRKDAARAAWEKVLKQNPGDQTAIAYLARLEEM